MLVYLSLGSNEGDRQENLRKAVGLVGELPSTRVLRCSSLMETPAEGFVGNDFLNMCIAVDTALPAQDLLDALKGIEAGLGREVIAPQYDRDGRRIYRNRPIDIDILLYGDETINTETLQVPHPRMRERMFVMAPLREIFPDIDNWV